MEIIKTEEGNSTSVSCNGESKDSGHPMIYLEIDKEIGKIDCPYCGKIFHYKENKNSSD